MQKERNSNIEILRIISMLMIIGHHCIYYGVMQTYNKSINNVIYGQGSFINKMIAQFEHKNSDYTEGDVKNRSQAK